MPKGLRQGDVLLRPTNRVRGERMKAKEGRHILAYGEQTGHDHSVPASNNVAVLLHRDGMQVSGIGELLHQEHNKQDLRGDYEVVQQRRASLTDHRMLRPAD